MNSSEIAKLAQVSRTTVSRVLNHHPGVSEKTRARVEAVIREQNYFPDAAARNLVGKQNRVLGLFILDLNAAPGAYTITHSQFFYSYIAYAADIASLYGYNLLTTVIHKDNLEDIDRLFQSRSITGGILMGDHLDDQALKRFSAQGYHMVLYNQFPHSPSPNIVTINYDNFLCGQMAAEELIRHGHRRIAYITGEPDKLSVQMRLAGFESALANAGISFDRDACLEYGTFNRRSGAYDAACRLLRRSQNAMPTAMCAGSATVLMASFEAIRDMGLRIPEDISLIGIDELDSANYTSPPLSLIATSCEEVAKRTVARLVDLVENGEQDLCEHTIRDVALVARKSIRAI